MNDECNVNVASPGRASGNGDGPASAPKATPPFSAADLLPFVNALGRRWKWLFIGGVAMAMVGLTSGLFLFKNSYTASAQLLRQASAQVTEVLGDRELDPNTYAGLLRAPELLERVAAQARPPVSPEWLSKRLNITLERNSDLILIAVSTLDKPGAVQLANLYAQAAVGFMQELQTNAAARTRVFLTQQLAPLEDEITALNKAQPVAVRRPVAQAVVAARSPLLDKLPAAQMELAELLARYTEQHPLVREQKARVAAIEGQLLQMPAGPPTAAGVSGDVNTEPLPQERDPVFLQTKLQSLENARLALLGQKQAAISLETQPPGTCRLLSPATLKEAIPHKRTAKVTVLTGFGGMLGFLIAGAFILLGEAVDPRLKTAADLRRVTRLPVVASVGDLSRLTEAEQRNWAFRSWTSLQRLLSPSPNQGFVCGITSSESGEGRSTWIRLLAEEASQRGYRVLTIIARPPEHNHKAICEHNGKAMAEQNGEAIADSGPDLDALVTTNGNSALVTNHVLTTPDEVTQKLIGPNPEPVVEIPLPGWVWNLERRKQWQSALHNWSQIDNIAVLVELPPASLPETVLLAENLPNVIWLADGEKATAVKTREQLETLRNARCHLAGAVLNRAPVSVLKNRLARWLGCAVLIFPLPGLSAHSQENQTQSTKETAGVANTDLSLSVVNSATAINAGSYAVTPPGERLGLGVFIPAGSGVQVLPPVAPPPP